jgi:tellurite resistance protein TerC
VISGSIWLWVIFNVFVILLLALDLGVFHRKSHVISIKEAFKWSAFWIVLALLFNLGIFIWSGPDKALEFLTGYLIEKSLSVDNLFVFILLFSFFRVPAANQHKVLFWGIIGALVMRIIFIFAGITLIQKFHWITYLLGVFLVVSGAKLAFQKDREVNPDKNPVVRFFGRFMPVTKNFKGDRFFVKDGSVRLATPLFIALLAIETTDVFFAADSIPAILAITLDPFIVYSSNVFAILGLRALYFALAGFMRLFHLLHYGLALILVFVGVKMLIADLYKIPIGISLGVVAGILTVSIVASVVQRDMENKRK